MISTSLEGGDALRARLARMTANTQNLEPALLRSGLVVLKAAQQRINSGGPGWAPNATGTPLLHQTGRLLSSLTVGGADSVSQVSGSEIVVGTNVKYARWLQDGTGIFGPTGEPITPKNGKFLVFNLGGAKIFARSVKGTPPRRFLFVDDQIATRVRAIFAKHVLGGDVTQLPEATS